MGDAVMTNSHGGDTFRRNERGAEAFARAARHSRKVRVFKVVLPMAAVLIIVAFFGYSYLPRSGDVSVDLIDTTIESGELVMANPTLDGFTGSNQPYSVTARKARQPVGEPLGAFSLEEILATVPFGDEDSARIIAGGGNLDRQSNRLILDNMIDIETTSGIRAKLQSAEVDLATKTVQTKDPVTIEMNGVRITADRFETADGGEKLVFDGGVQIQVQPSEVKRGANDVQEAADE